MLKRKVSSMRNAFKGIRIAAKEEHNFQFHIFTAAAVVALGLLFQISVSEWFTVVLASGLVLATELLNTALEELCDMLRDTHDPHVGKIKDLAAGAVLLASIVALVVGVAIFLPKILSL